MQRTPKRRTREPRAVKNPTGRLTVLYIAALSAVALLSLVGQAVVQQQLQRQMSDSRVVNIAGRQRMFSQRLAKSALLLASPTFNGRRDALLKTARETLTLWRQCHEGLQQGDDGLGLPGRNSPEVTRMFARLDGEFGEIAAGMGQLLDMTSSSGGPTDADAAKMAAPLRRVLDHEAAFLAGMDAIVFQYAREAHERVARLRAIEWILVALTLSVLLIEGTFVFRPAVRRLAAAMAQLDRTQRVLIRSRDAARAASEAKTRFLANISHELRTPLNAVIGMTELARTTHSPTKRELYLETVADASQSLLVLLNDLIDLSRVEANQLRLQESSVNVVRLVHGAAALLRHAADEKGLDLRVEVDEGVPTTILGDELRMRQVLVNLLSNAVKFTAAGHVALTCRRATTLGCASVLRFSVSDTGIGIASGDERRIFEHFYQADGRAGQPGGGVGLGLPISEKVAELMGGTITVESTPSVGSTFHFEMPLRTPSLEDLAEAGPVTPHRSVAPSTDRSLRVLVVEDSPVNQVLVRELLEAAGHAVEVAGSGHEAAALLDAKAWDAAVIDISLPDTTGWQVIQTLRDVEKRSGPRRIGVVVITAHAGLDGDCSPHTAEYDSLLVKPFTPRDLQEAVRTSVARPEEGHTPDDRQAIDAQPPVADAATFNAAEDCEMNWTYAVHRLEGDEDLAMRLLEVLSQELASQRSEIAALAARGDRRRLRLVVHRLIGQVSNFEAPKTIAALTRLDAAAADDDEPLADVVADVVAALALLSASVDEKLAVAGSARA
jgi:signal transduction histidine kinase/CheY-like chemotaxis protein